MIDPFLSFLFTHREGKDACAIEQNQESLIPSFLFFQSNKCYRPSATDLCEVLDYGQLYTLRLL